MSRIHIPGTPKTGAVKAAAKRRAPAAKAAKEAKDSIWTRDISFGPAFPAKERARFFQMLSVLLDSGLSITESLEVIASQTGSKRVKGIVESIAAELNEGKSLSDAVSARPKHFSPFELHSIRMGEAAGRMVKVLEDLAVFHEKRLRLQRKVIQAMSYPAVVLFIAGGVLWFMMSFVVPMFEDIFARFDAGLPVITEWVLAWSTFFQEWGGFLFMGLITMITAAVLSRKKTWFRRFTGRLLLRTPLIGKIILKVQLSRFCYTLSLMLRSRVNLDQALHLLGDIVTFEPLQRPLEDIRKHVIDGESMHEAFSRHNIFPPVMLQMIRVGERTARLEDMLVRLGKNLEEESESGISTLTGLLEPIMIVLIGLVVGVILVSMYLPMFELSNAVGP